MEGRALILLSGGIDSTVLAYQVMTQDPSRVDHILLSFDYNQKHRVAELDCAKQTADDFNWQHRIAKIVLPYSGSIIEGDSERPDTMLTNGLASSYLPGRNTIFLAIAFGMAEHFTIDEIYIGATKEDQLGFPDCRSQYFIHMEHLANHLRKANDLPELQIRYPLINKTKGEIIAEGESLDVNWSQTMSCYTPIYKNSNALHPGKYIHCGRCLACQVRRKGFHCANINDETEYDYVGIK